jgi:hypothetical protein
VGELPVFFGEHLQLGPAPAGCPDLPRTDGQDEGASLERGEEAGVVGSDAYGEATAVGEPEDRPFLAVALNSGDTAIDGHRVFQLRPAGQTLVQPGVVAGRGAVAELAPVALSVSPDTGC